MNCKFCDKLIYENNLCVSHINDYLSIIHEYDHYINYLDAVKVELALGGYYSHFKDIILECEDLIMYYGKKKI